MVILATSSSDGQATTVIVALVAFVLYLAPTIIAYDRKRQNMGQVVVVNLLLGWTLIGWIIALVMAFGTTRAQATS